MKRFPLFLLLISSLTANAEQISVSWTHPTERDDGTPLALSEIRETRIFCTGAATPVVIIPAPATVALIELPLGETKCNARTVDTNGTRSIFSEQVTFTVTVKLPAAPNAPKQIIIILGQ
jgi:hypothetical protein